MKIIVIGGGQIGSYVARMMLESGNDVKIIEHREKLIKDIRHHFPDDLIIEGDEASPKVLEKAGISEADVLAAVTDADEINLVASTIAKFEFQTDRVIACVNNPKNDWLFTAEMGVDVKISQANLLARVIADQIDMDNMVTLMRLNHGDNSIVEVTVHGGAKADGFALKDIPIPNETVLIAIQRGNKNIVARGNTVLKAGDHILAYTKTDDQGVLFELMR